MGTSQERSSASQTFFTKGDYIPGIRVSATLKPYNYEDVYHLIYCLGSYV